MTQTLYCSPQKSLLVGVLVALIAMVAPGAQAAFTDSFDDLTAELQLRSAALTGSTDKIEQKRKKAVDKALAAIDKPATSLATDVKTAGKVAKSLAKAFPDEFATSLVFSNDLSVLLDGVFDNLESNVTAQLTALQDTVNALPDGKAKTKALASVADGQTALDELGTAPDNAAKVKLLAAALKAIASGTKAANSGGGGGGGGCNASTLTMTVSNEGPQWNSTVAVASYTTSTGDLIIGGTRGASPNPFDVVAIGTSNVTVQGDYTLGETSVGGTTTYVTGAGTTNTVLYELVSGTIHIAAINPGPVGQPTGETSGTFHFTAQDAIDTNIVITLDGSFEICDMVTFATPP